MNNLIAVYILNKKQNNYLIIYSLLAICLLLMRIKITHSIYHLFLIWNLFLAFIPYLFSSHIKVDLSLKTSNFKNLFYIFIWLLFLPNTFYLLTDFVHLHHENQFQFWFDFIMLSCFTVAGFYFGILSIFTIQQQIQFFYTKSISIFFTISISYLCGFGIYLGRFLRFNSWDILSNPLPLINSIFSCLFQSEVWIFTLEFGTLIYLTNILYQKINPNN